VCFLFGVSFFGLQSVRQMYFILAIGDLLTAAALAGAAKWVIARLASRRLFQLPMPVIVNILVGMYVLIALVPAVSASVNIAQDALKPDRRNDLATYMDTSLAPAPYIATADNHKTLNPDYGGYHGKNEFPLISIANLIAKPIEEWRAQNVVYAIVPYGDSWKTYAPGQLLLLKSYPPDHRFRGPSMQVLRLQPIQTPLDKPLQLGSLQLIGYDLSASEVPAGSDVTLTYYWKADAPTTVPFRVFTHVYPMNRIEVITQQDGVPLSDDLGRRPTSAWNDPDEVIVSRPFTLHVPIGTAYGRYRVALGFYDPDGNQRLFTPSGESFVTVTEIEVVPPA
jgi:hypothetical protein